MLALGVADSDDDAVLWGRLWRVDAFAQLGRINDADAELTLLAPTVARLRSPGPTGICGAARRPWPSAAGSSATPGTSPRNASGSRPTDTRTCAP